MLEPLPHIVSAAARADFKVHIGWSDGSAHIFDFSTVPEVRPACSQMKDIAFFEEALRIGMRGRSISWGGEIEYCADSLWYRAHPEAYRRDFPAYADQ
ncbi:MAG: hypothetical protein ACOVN0_09440 [Niveispirillum sp.]|uniref:hypothetical protein n=1 Tax=Niveispirillum sp. TaxID=1917217 RepID=UPI003BA58186